MQAKSQGSSLNARHSVSDTGAFTRDLGGLCAKVETGLVATGLLRTSLSIT
jgi:hypothetical protein